MKLFCALIKISLVLHVTESACSTDSDEKARTINGSEKGVPYRFPVLWNQYIGNVLQGQELPHLYCCHMPMYMQSCVCCANLCSIQQPVFPSRSSCCNLPKLFQNCNCCPSACQDPIEIPPQRDCCNLPLPFFSCSCCPSACQLPPVKDCCDLAAPLRNCRCCPSACREPVIPEKRRCCHWPKFLQTCDCCEDVCGTSPTVDCCDLPEINQSCLCCPAACKQTTTPHNCCNFPKKLRKCSCCPSLCTTMTTIKTTPKPGNCCHLPKKLQKCNCCPRACKSTTTTTTEVSDCCNLAPNKIKCECCPSACAEPSTTEVTEAPSDCCHLAKGKQKCECCPAACRTTTKPSNCCNLPKKQRKCSCCPRECRTTTTKAISTTEPPNCCNLPPSEIDCDCCPLACIDFTSDPEVTTDQTQYNCCNYPKELQKCSCCAEACAQTSTAITTSKPRNCCNAPKKHRKCSCCPSACKTSTISINTDTTKFPDCCDVPPDEMDCSCCPSACEAFTTTEPTTSITTTTADCCDRPKHFIDCKCCPSFCKSTTDISTTDIPTTTDTTTTERVTRSEIITTTKRTTTKHTTVDLLSTTDSIEITTETPNCCDFPKKQQNCSCCPELCQEFTSITFPTDCCHMKDEISCHCCPSACEHFSSTDSVETTPTETTEDITESTTTSILTTIPTYNCCDVPKYYQRCSCCATACGDLLFPLSQKSCCNWPKHLQKCDCCVSVCIGSHPTPDRTSCCYLPPSMQQCWCCATSSRCNKFEEKRVSEPSNSCCNLPPNKQKCHCCSTAPSCVPDVSDSDCCDLPKEKQNCDCCPSSCPTPKHNIFRMLMSMLSIRPRTEITDRWGTSPPSKVEHRPETSLLKHPKLFSFLLRSPFSLNRIIPNKPKSRKGFSRFRKTFGTRGYSNRNLLKMGALKRSFIPTYSYNGQNLLRTAEELNDVFRGNSKFDGGDLDLSEDDLEQFLNKFREEIDCDDNSSNKNEENIDILEALFDQRALDNFDGDASLAMSSPREFNVATLPFEDGYNTDNQYPWNVLVPNSIASDIVNSGTIDGNREFNAFIFENLYRLVNSKSSSDDDKEDTTKPLRLYAPPSINDFYKSNILEKLAKIATGVSVNHGEVEFSKAKDIGNLLFDSFNVKGDKKHDPTTLPPKDFSFDNKNFDYKTKTADLYPWLNPYFLQRITSAMNANKHYLDPYSNRILVESDGKPLYVLGKVRSGPFPDISSRMESDTSSDSSGFSIGDTYYRAIMSDQYPRKVSFGAKHLDRLLKLREVFKRFKNNPLRTSSTTVSEDSNPKKYLVNNILLQASNETKALPTSKINSTLLSRSFITKNAESRRIKRSYFYGYNSESGDQKQVNKNPCATDEINILKRWISKFVKPYRYEEDHHANKFYNPHRYGLSFDSLHQSDKKTNENLDFRISPSKASYSKPTLWPVVYGTMDPTELDTPEGPATPTPDLNGNNNHDRNADQTALQSYPVVFVIPQVLPLNFPFHPYLNTPLGFPLQYCLFDSFNQICQEILKRKDFTSLMPYKYQQKPNIYQSTYSFTPITADIDYNTDYTDEGYSDLLEQLLVESPWLDRYVRNPTEKSEADTKTKPYFQAAETVNQNKTNYGHSDNSESVTETIVPLTVGTR